MQKFAVYNCTITLINEINIIFKGGVEPHYNYSYQRVTDGPSTPDLRRGHNNNNNNSNNNSSKLGAGDYNSYRSNASGASTNPPTPVLIQVSGAGGGKYIIKWSQKGKGVCVKIIL